MAGDPEVEFGTGLFELAGVAWGLAALKNHQAAFRDNHTW
jgi:hypothetical protein